MTPIAPAKRLMCAVCLRPGSSCICPWVTPTRHLAEVVILQHPLEVMNAKGSARLLHLSLAHSRMVTGEVFDAPLLRGLLTEPFDAQAQNPKARQPVLLYPQTPQDAALGLAVAPRVSPEWLSDPSSLRLIVLDGTWRKSRKMLYLNPPLQGLPRLALQDMAASHYLIRKAHRPDQLSTLEATCAALAQLEGSAAPLAPLLAAFDGFVAQQLGYRVKADGE